MKILILALLLILSNHAAHSNYSTPGTGKTWNLDSLVANSAEILHLIQEVTLSMIQL